MSSLWTVQEAAVARWLAWPAVAALVGDRVFDGRAPDGAEYPRIVVGLKTETPGGVLGGQACSDTLTTHVFTQGEETSPGVVIDSDALGLRIAAAMEEAMEEPLVLDGGYGTVTLQREMLETLIDPDETRHVVIRFRAFAYRD